MAQDTLKSLPEEAPPAPASICSYHLSSVAGQVQEKQLPALIEKLVNKLRKAEQVHRPQFAAVQPCNMASWEQLPISCLTLSPSFTLSLLEEKMDEVVAVPAPPPVAEVILGRVGPTHLVALPLQQRRHDFLGLRRVGDDSSCRHFYMRVSAQKVWQTSASRGF